MLLLDAPHELDFRSKLDQFEGRCPYPYLDGDGNVTVGVGCLLDSFDAFTAIGWLGSGDQVVADWRALTASTVRQGMPAAQYSLLTKIRLPNHEIDKLLDARIGEMEAGLIKAVSGVGALPQNVRQALCDLAFNMGPGRLKMQFFGPNCRFGPAVYAGDWQTAAKESARRGIQPARNEYVVDLFMTTLPE